MWGFSPSIGILGGGELGGEGVRIGDIGTELPGGKGNNQGFREKAKGLESTDYSLSVVEATVIRGGVVNLGVGNYFVVLGLHQGTTSRERGVTRISPSNPRSRGESSAKALPKFRKRETSEKGLLGS